MSQFAYIRVSTKEQSIDRQILALEPYGIPRKNVFCDHQSGKDFKRPAYQRLLKRLRSDDLLIIKSIDRLGRNYNEILEQWQYITKKIGADILVLDMSLLDTRDREGDLTGTLIADLVLQILAYVAETERAFIRQRQAEGIAAAKAKGIRFGCQKIETPHNFREYFEMWEQGEISSRNAASALNMSHSTFYRRCREEMETGGGAAKGTIGL